VYHSAHASSIRRIEAGSEDWKFHLNTHLGEIAALATAVSWAFGATMFSVSASRIGSVNVNSGRLAVAAAFLSLSHFIVTGSFLPIAASPARWMWLGLSGIVGFIIGDAMLFEAFVLVGPRISMLLMSLVPIMSALLAWIFLGETLKFVEIFAIALTVGGIIWVVADKRKGGENGGHRKWFVGIVFGIGGAMGQTLGMVLSKKGLEGDFPALSGNVIRVVTATLLLWLITAVAGKASRTLRSYKDKKALLTLIAGSFFGPFIGVWLSLVSIKYARLGIATTLMSLTPIFLIPITRIAFGERVTMGAVIGTIVACTGVMVLLLV
jgi:drug/metabolite transporter (DMT)-like permease